MQTIEAPPVQPPVYSLLAAADTPGPGSDRWQIDGAQWSPEAPADGGAVAVNCSGSSPDGKPLADHAETNTAAPFAVYADDHCSTLGSVERDFEGRSRRQLAATQSYFIAREFQLGLLRDAAIGSSSLGDNVALVDGQQIGPGGDPITALMTLEQALADTFRGARAMVHVTVAAFVKLAAELAIYQPAGSTKWYTNAGNVVAMDAGYTAEGGDVFMYGTSLVVVRLVDATIVPPTLAEATDRRTNFVAVRAERLALVLLDHSDAAPADLIFKVDTGLSPWAAGS